MEIQTFEEFSDQHGGQYFQDMEGNARIWRFADGARVVLQNNFTTFDEPPADPEALLRRRRDYHARMYHVFRHSFDSLKLALTVGTDANAWPSSWPEQAGPMPEADDYGDYPDINALNKLKELGAVHRQALKEIDEALAAMPHRVARREALERQKEEEAREQEQFDRQRAEIEVLAFDDDESPLTQTQILFGG